MLRDGHLSSAPRTSNFFMKTLDLKQSPQHTLMTCYRCCDNPSSHSFRSYDFIQGITYYYTAPVEATVRINTDEAYAEFKTHLDGARQDGRWIWLFDCSGMTLEHYSSVNFLRNLVHTLVEEHDQALQEVIILHPSFWIRSAVWMMWPLMNANLHQKIRFLETKKDLDVELLGKRVLAIA